MSSTPSRTPAGAPPSPPRPPVVPVVAAVLALGGLVGAAFTGWIALFSVYGLPGSTVGLQDGRDWLGYLMAVVATALLLAGGPLVMGIGWRDRRWLVAAAVVAGVVLVVGLVIGLTAG